MEKSMQEESNNIEQTIKDQQKDEKIILPDIKYDCSKVYIKLSEVHARGVFAKEDIKYNDVIEIFPITPSYYRTKYQGDAQVIAYGFVNHACHCEECKRHGYLIYISSGYGNMYNHQPDFNASYEINFQQLYGTIRAVKPIEKDEEIFINYSSTYLFQNGLVTNYENPPGN